MSDYEDITGERFGSLVAEFYGGKMKSSHRWACRCDCGSMKVTTQAALRGGRSRHCGCKNGEIANSSHPLYYRYETMRYRCYNEKAISYKDYGARGITVCDRWMEDGFKGFKNFLEDMDEPPQGYQLDRIDVNSPYGPDNCRWIDLNNQHFNTRMHSTNTSGRTGVTWNKSTNRWVASIRVNGKVKHLICSKSFEDACKAREKAEIEVYGYSKE